MRYFPIFLYTSLVFHVSMQTKTILTTSIIFIIIIIFSGCNEGPLGQATGYQGEGENQLLFDGKTISCTPVNKLPLTCTSKETAVSEDECYVYDSKFYGCRRVQISGHNKDWGWVAIDHGGISDNCGALADLTFSTCDFMESKKADGSFEFQFCLKSYYAETGVWGNSEISSRYCGKTNLSIVHETSEYSDGGFCGDGLTGYGEECDGNMFAYTTVRQCANTLRFGKQLKDGPNGGVTCNIECTVNLNNCIVACGDGINDLGEDCDDGNKAYGDGCTPECKSEGKIGVGIVTDGKSQAPEQCEGEEKKCKVYTCISEKTNPQTGASTGLIEWNQNADEIEVLANGFDLGNKGLSYVIVPESTFEGYRSNDIRDGVSCKDGKVQEAYCLYSKGDYIDAETAAKEMIVKESFSCPTGTTCNRGVCS